MHTDIFDEGLEKCAESRVWQRLQNGDRAPGWGWNAAAGGDDGGCLCGPQWSVLRRALPRALEVQGFNECFMLHLEPALSTVYARRSYVLFLCSNKGEKANPALHVKIKSGKINLCYFIKRRKCSLNFNFICHQNYIKFFIWVFENVKIMGKIFLYSSPLFFSRFLLFMHHEILLH